MRSFLGPFCCFVVRATGQADPGRVPNFLLVSTRVHKRSRAHAFMNTAQGIRGAGASRCETELAPSPHYLVGSSVRAIALTESQMI